MDRIIYRKSFAAKLITARTAIPVYQAIKDLCAMHKKVNTRLTFKKEVITYRGQKVAMMKIYRKNISLFLILDPNDFERKKYHFKDISSKKIGAIFPMKMIIKSHRALNNALVLLEEALKKVGATQLCKAKLVDYEEIFYDREMNTLVAQGLAKKYLQREDDEKIITHRLVADMCTVKITANIENSSKNAGAELYLLTNYTNWNSNEAILMKKDSAGVFTASLAVPKNTNLEVKICRAENWINVGNGVWKDELASHQCIVEEDVNIVI